jgi:hypothetical protein
MKLTVDATTRRVVTLYASPLEVGHYFSHNAGLLGALIGDRHVEDLGDNTYRIRPLSLSFLGMDWSPHMVVQFHDLPGVTRMVSQDCLVESPVAWGPTAVARIEGEACFETAGDDTRLSCIARAEVELMVTPPWSWAPEPLLRQTLQTGLQAAMEAMADRFPGVIRRDFLEWRRRRTGATP